MQLDLHKTLVVMLCAHYDIFCCILRSIILNVQNNSKNKSTYILNILPLFCEKQKTVKLVTQRANYLFFASVFHLVFYFRGSVTKWKGLLDFSWSEVFLKKTVMTKSGWINIWDIFEFVSKYYSVRVLFGLVVLVHQSKVQFK